MPADDTASSVVKDETARQAVILLFSIAGLVVSYFAYMKLGRDFQDVQRNASEADFSRTQRMHQAKLAERFFAKTAAWCWRRAEQSRLAYERDRA